MLHMIPEFIEKQMMSLVSIGSYTFAKILGVVQLTTSIKDTWHFQLLQELAFVAAILSFILAVFNYHNNRKTKKSNVKIHKVHKPTKTKG